MTVYSDKNTSPVLESSELKPLHTYGLSKVYAESLIKYYDFRSLIIRIPGIYGGNRQSGLIYNTINKLKKDEAMEIDTENLGYWEIMHIDDMLYLFFALMQQYTFKSKFDIFNISYGEKTDIIETVHFIANELSSNSKICIEKKYQDLYLSNQKISIFSQPLFSFNSRLKKYIREVG